MRKHIIWAIIIVTAFTACSLIGYYYLQTKSTSFSTLISTSVISLIIGLPLRYFTYIVSLFTDKDKETVNSPRTIQKLNRLNRMSLIISATLFTVGSGFSLGLYLNTMNVQVFSFSLMCLGFGGLIGSIFPFSKYKAEYN